jgi:hypothetical protein
MQYMLHIHFGTGRLGLGLIAPAFKKPGSELYLLNRSVSDVNATGSTSLSPNRRNELLSAGTSKRYFIAKPGGGWRHRREVLFDGFATFDSSTLRDRVEEIITQSSAADKGVLVSASVLTIENYQPVLQALNLLAERRAKGLGIGKIYFVACENTLSAAEVFNNEAVAAFISDEARAQVTCVHALVDRMCVGLEEIRAEGGAAVLVRAEEYGSVKLELCPASQGLVELCRGSTVEFSQHVDVEKQIKSWLLNGTHWLIALEAFDRTKGDQSLKLNEFLMAEPSHMAFARAAMSEMREGVAIILRKGRRFHRFVQDVDVETYLHGTAGAILSRFCATEDPITRILARFRAPTPEATDTIVSFTKRFADRVDEPMRAYEARRGVPPPAASRGVNSLVRLLSLGTFINAPAV